MSRLTRIKIISLFVLGGGLALPLFFEETKRIGVINYTKSIPLGVYLFSNDTPMVGDYVYLPDFKIGNKGIIKALIGTEGDSYAIKNGEVFINGVLIIVPFPPLGHPPFFSGSGFLNKNEYILIGEDPKSFDSRYLGVIKTKSLIKIKRWI